MARKNDWQRVREAVEGGLVRRLAIRAAPDQVLRYVLSDRKFFPHATLESARAEKAFLEAALDRKIRIYKMWNERDSKVENDMTLIRAEAEKLPAESGFYAALNRVLIGAGF